MDTRKILVWFRNDLRLHDNEMLVEAIAKSDSILPVYIFDPEVADPLTVMDYHAAPCRLRFLIESVAALRKSFQAFGGDLLVMSGKPDLIINTLVEDYQIAEVYHHREVSSRETTDSSLVEDLLWKQKVNLKHFIGHTLYNKEDLPFPIKDIPDVFSQFKKKTERDAMVKDCLAVPLAINFVELEDWGVLPEVPVCPEGLHQGGEAEGIRNLELMLHTDSPVHGKKNAKVDFFSGISPYLATGCLSPRKVYWEIKNTLKDRSVNPALNSIIQGLLMRDFYRFMLKKHGINFYKEKLQLQPEQSDPGIYAADLDKWKNGLTGHAAVDALMNELNNTGQMNYAGRLLVATYLVHVLKINWLEGVRYFKRKLIDYSAASNWGNWANVAGAALDPKSKNLYDLDKQMKILNLPDQI